MGSQYTLHGRAKVKEQDEKRNGGLRIFLFWCFVEAENNDGNQQQRRLADSNMHELSGVERCKSGDRAGSRGHEEARSWRAGWLVGGGVRKLSGLEYFRGRCSAVARGRLLLFPHSLPPPSPYPFPSHTCLPVPPTRPTPVPLWCPLSSSPPSSTLCYLLLPCVLAAKWTKRRPTNPPATPPVIHYHLFAFHYLPPFRQQHQLCALVDQFGYTRPQQDIDRLPGGTEGGREGRGGTEEEVRREEGPGREEGGAKGA